MKRRTLSKFRSGKVKRPGNRQFRKLMGFSQWTSPPPVMAPKHSKTSIWGAVIISGRGFLEPHQFPERRAVGLLFATPQCLQKIRSSFPMILGCNRLDPLITEVIRALRARNPPKVEKWFPAAEKEKVERKQWKMLKRKVAFYSLVARCARIDSHDSRESPDSRESEIRVIQANQPDAL